MAELLNGIQIAARYGISKQAVSKAKADGRIVPAAHDERLRPLYDADQVYRTFIVNYSQVDRATDPGGRPPASGTIPKRLTRLRAPSSKPRPGGTAANDRIKLMKATAAHKEAQARLAALKLQEKEKSLISVEQVKKDGAELGTILLGHIQAFPARLAPQLASMKEADEFEFNRVLTVAMNNLIIAIRGDLGLDSGPGKDV